MTTQLRAPRLVAQYLNVYIYQVSYCNMLLEVITHMTSNDVKMYGFK